MTLQQALNRALLNLQGDATSARAEFRFSGDEFFFQGHFPAGPVLPAVVQVGAAVELCSRLLQCPQRLVEVSRAKFTNPAGPGRTLQLTLSMEPTQDARTRVRATLADGGTEVSEFTLRLEPERA